LISKFEFAILSHNKAKYTKKLIETIFLYEKSIDFTISILDQASHKEERLILEEILNVHPELKLLDSNVNLGVGGGRNFLIEHSSSEWMIFLDNDLELNGSILDELKNNINTFNFFAIPFFESEISNSKAKIPYLYLEGEQGTKSAYAGLGGVDYSDYLKGRVKSENIGIAGGALAANLKRLKEIGGYRSPGLVGYEDVELTLRLHALKESISVLQVSPLRHNKEIQVHAISRESEIQRLDVLELKANANFIERIHGYRVWSSNQYTWLIERAKNAQIEQDIARILNPIKKEMKRLHSRPIILLVCDKPGWALHNIALKYKEMLSHDFDFVITFTIDWYEFTKILFSEHWDGVIFLWRVPLFQLIADDQYPIGLLKKTGFHVCDHQGDMGYDKEVAKLLTGSVKIAYVNKKLYHGKSFAYPNSYYVPDGVDTNLFYPADERSLSSGFKIGWIGNRLWGGLDDVKGYKSVIDPALKKLDRISDRIFFEPIDASRGSIPKFAVASLMRNWDVVICTSSHEGTPNPILEGISSGLCVISTRVGMTGELSESGAQINYINREADELVQKILELSNLDKSKLEFEKIQNREASLKWDWKNIGHYYQTFIESLL
jgi:glycosyltransferase involved in cell wall biosynthesis